jgi:hypothetical protein
MGVKVGGVSDLSDEQAAINMTAIKITIGSPNRKRAELNRL